MALLQVRRGVRVFRNVPLKFIPEHHAVYSGRIVTLNKSGVVGHRPAPPQVLQEAQILGVDDLTNLALLPPSPEPSLGPRRRGKRIMTPGYSSGGNSKGTRRDSTGDAFNRLADLRVQSNESKARREEQKQAKSARACMEMLKADGISMQDPIYHTVLRMFCDGYLCEFFIEDCTTPEGRMYFIQLHGAPNLTPDPLLFAPPPPPTCSGHVEGWYKMFGPHDDDGSDSANGGADGSAVF
ncbi:uncharacterized protein LOC127755712 [Oryza glaberrima]|uniref:uncharacterized protein LOC127755712 n=1 Tax=Oryza glaberrima TaxID=4538 RepID=UPI00224C021B|nr:uncharacterized protein LOC127755712 [Oryza glaberrima]